MPNQYVLNNSILVEVCRKNTSRSSEQSWQHGNNFDCQLVSLQLETRWFIFETLQVVFTVTKSLGHMMIHEHVFFFAL